MNIEELRDFCMAQKAVSESFPFDETTLVFKVLGKMFCLTDTEDEFSINIKNDPEKIIQFREEYPAVLPGYHMNKKYWNTVMVDGSISDKILKEWVMESYWSVVHSMPKKKQQELNDIK